MAFLTLDRSRNELNELARLQNQMDELFSKFMAAGFESPISERSMWPRVDIADKGEEIIVMAEVPGCRAEDVDISVMGNTLTISGEKKEPEEKKGFYHNEGFYGQFRRDVNLTSEIDANRVSAVCKNGILTIIMQKSEKTKGQHIKVLSSGS